MSIRKTPLVTNEIYHIMSRSIAGFKVFKKKNEFLRMTEVLRLSQFENFSIKYSKFVLLPPATRAKISEELIGQNDCLVEIIAYCLMPTHIHLLLRQAADNGVSRFVCRSLNSYSKYFNITNNRRGPLWETRFKNARVTSDEQLLHLTRYIHLNPTSAGLAQKPEDWEFSSYHEYLNGKQTVRTLTNFRELLPISPRKYKEFVEERKDFQKELSKIKHLLIENYTG